MSFQMITILLSFWSFSTPLGQAGDQYKYSILEENSEQLRFRSNSGIEFRCVLIKPSEFEMGDKKRYVSNKLLRGAMTLAGHGSAHPSDAGPIRKTKISKGYYILDTKVTAEAYCEFLNEVNHEKNRWIVLRLPVIGGYSEINLKEGRYVPFDKLERAVVSTATWHGASAYCEWLSKKLGRKVRLPTEAEWEFCAKGPEGKEYPWGPTRDNKVNYGYFILPDDPQHTFAKAYPANATPQQVYDMIGPVAEWCSDLYQRKYDINDIVDPKGPKNNDDGAHVLRGRRLETTYRDKNLPEASVGAGIYGFRFVVEETPK